LQDYFLDKDPDWLFRAFLDNIAARGLSSYVRPWRMSTLEAARRWSGEPISLLYYRCRSRLPRRAGRFRNVGAFRRTWGVRCL
jgi:hypothetical protein